MLFYVGLKIETLLLLRKKQCFLFLITDNCIFVFSFYVMETCGLGPHEIDVNFCSYQIHINNYDAEQNGGLDKHDKLDIRSGKSTN